MSSGHVICRIAVCVLFSLPVYLRACSSLSHALLYKPKQKNLSGVKVLPQRDTECLGVSDEWAIVEQRLPLYWPQIEPSQYALVCLHCTNHHISVVITSVYVVGNEKVKVVTTHGCSRPLSSAEQWCM